MDSPSSSNFNWNNLPNEIKLEIIRKLDNHSRLSLRACSVNDRLLVDSIPYRTIHKMCIWNDDDGKWHIDMTRNMYGSEASFVLDSFQEFQNKLAEEIEKSDCIDLLEAYQKETSKQLKLSKSGKQLRVRELIFAAYNEDALDVLAQIDPSHLRKLQLYQNGLHEGVLDIPQTKQVHNLWSRGNQTTDDQLLKLENPELYLEDTNIITIAGINMYIKKCLLTLDDKPVSFRIEFNESKNDFDELFEGIEALEIDLDSPNPRIKQWEYILNSKSEKYQLAVKYCCFYIEAKTIGRNGQVAITSLQDSEPLLSFKSVNYINISPKRLTITARRTAPIHYVFDSNDEIQNKLTEEINKLDYIKHLRITDTSHDWILCPPNKQITVGKLSVYRGDISLEFLRQIEPVHLKEVTIHGYFDDGRLYDTQQLMNAQKLDIANCCIQDQQLINSEATQIFFNTVNHKNLTDSGINQFIKKILTNLNLRDYNFGICHPGVHRKSVDLFKYLDVFSKERVDSIVTKYIVNSPFPEFKLELSKMEGTILGKRVNVVDM